MQYLLNMCQINRSISICKVDKTFCWIYGTFRSCTVIDNKQIVAQDALKGYFQKRMHNLLLQLKGRLLNVTKNRTISVLCTKELLWQLKDT